MQYKNHSYYQKINRRIINQKATIIHYDAEKQKNNLLNTIAYMKVKFTKMNHTFEMFFI